MIQQLPFPYDHRGQITRLNTAHFTALEAARRRLEAETTIKSKAIAATRRQLRQAESGTINLFHSIGFWYGVTMQFLFEFRMLASAANSD
jgi:hypothetical protein